MHPTKLALLRCENLDLFGTAVSTRVPPLDGTDAEAPVDEGGFLFRIRPDDQLDLFRHSPAETAANEVRRALKDLSPERVHAGLAMLRKASAYMQFVVDCEHCIELIERRDPRWADAALAVPWIETLLSPAAVRCLQRDAMVLLRPALLALIDQGAAVAFDPDCPHAHSSYLWQRLDEPLQAVRALESDPLWQSQPAALIWHAELSEQAGLNERVTADVAELCFSWPEAAESWLSASPSWATRWTAWCELDDILPIHAFPAWCRLTRASEFPMPAASDQRSGATLLAIAHRLAESASDLTLRKALHAQCPALLAVYLSARAGSLR